MILEWHETEQSMSSLVAQPEEYDAFPPVNALLIDALPKLRHPDREALAGYLAFGRWTSGDLVLPDPLSPHVAEAIEADALPIRLRPRNVVLTPRALPRGERAVALHFGAPCNSPTSPALAVVPSTLARGVSDVGSKLVVPSNAFVLDHGDSPQVRARLAVAVLFAADVDADSVHLDGSLVPRDEAVRLSALLHSVNLEFAIHDAGR